MLSRCAESRASEGKIWERVPRAALAEVLLQLSGDEGAIQVREGAIVVSPRFVNAITWDADSVPFGIRANSLSIVWMSHELDEVLAAVGPRRLVLGERLRMHRLVAGLSIHSG